MPDNSLSTLHQESEESWRQRLDDAYERYHMASTRYRELLEKAPEGRVRSQDDPLALARHAESETLLEYTRLLKIVTDLTVRYAEHEMQSGVRVAEGKA